MTLTAQQMPSHSHTQGAAARRPRSLTPTATTVVTEAGEATYKSSGSNVGMATEAIGNTGGSQAHNNVQPLLVINYIIALQGLYPSRS